MASICRMKMDFEGMSVIWKALDNAGLPVTWKQTCLNFLLSVKQQFFRIICCLSLDKECFRNGCHLASMDLPVTEWM
jgi:hypothetical protein